MSDKLAFLSGPAAEAETVSAPAAEQTEPQSAPAPATSQTDPASGSQERGADGRFVSQAPEAAPAAQTPPVAAAPAAPAAAAPTEPTPPAGHVPLSVLLDEREKRQAYERQLAELRSRQAPAQPVPPEEQVQQALYAQNLRTSRRFAERTYTPELVATVHDWAARRCDEDPIFNQQMRSSEDPYEAAVQAYHRDQILAAVKTPAELEAFRAWQAAQAAGGAAPTAAAPASVTHTPTPNPTPAPPPPPRSLATASGNGAAGAPHVPVGAGEAFRTVIR